MNRRLFLQFPLVASALMTEAKSLSKDRPNKGLKVGAKKDRYQEELLIMGGKFDCKISAKDTDGDLLVYDTVRQSKGRPALHLHHEQDEWFYVIKGSFIVQVGEETFTLTDCDSAFAPRTVPHAFAKTSEGEAQMLILFQPAGSMEDFFKQMAKLGKEIPKNQEEVLKELWETHGLKVVGPPLKFQATKSHCSHKRKCLNVSAMTNARNIFLKRHNTKFTSVTILPLRGLTLYKHGAPLQLNDNQYLNK